MAGQIYWHQLDEELVKQIKDAFNGILTPDGTTITVNESGVISANGGDSYVLPTASTTVLGGVKVDGTTITIDANGVITSIVDTPVDIVNDLTTGGTDKALSAEQGKILKGLIDGIATYTLPTASTTVLGGVKVDGITVNIDADGIISAVPSVSDYTMVAPFLPTVKHNEAPIKIGVTAFLAKDAASFNAEWQASLKVPSTVNRFFIQTYKTDTTAIVPHQVVTAFQGTNYYAQYIRSAGALNWGASWKQVGQFDMLSILPDANFQTIPVGITSFFAVAGNATSGEAYTAWLTLIGETVGNDVDRAIHVHTEYTQYSSNATQTISLYDTTDGNKKLLSEYYRFMTSDNVWGAVQKIESNSYSLPIATTEILGGVKQGTGVTISEDGTISATSGVSEFSIIDAVLPTVLTSDSSYPEGLSIFSVNSSATYILEWAESVGALDELLDPEFNRAVVETYKNSEAPDTSYQLMRTFQGNIIGTVYSRLSHPTSNGEWTKIFSNEEKAKLEGIEEGANKYVLPVATIDILGGVKVDGATITANSEGVITSVTGGLDIPPALPTVGFTHYPNGVSSFFVTSSLEESREKFDAWLTLIGESPASHTTNKAIHVHTEKTPTIGLQRETLIQTIRLYDTRTGSDKLVSDNFRIGASSRWGVIHKINRFTQEEKDKLASLEKPKTNKFTTTVAEATIVNGSESETIFVYKPSIPILSTDDLDVNYNTTSLEEGDWRVQDVEGEMVIILNVTQDANIAKNSVSGRIYRGFSSI